MSTKFLALFLIFFPNFLFAKISIVFRFDDFLLNQDTINVKVIRLFENEKIPLVLGVIPCDSNENFYNDTTLKIQNLVLEGVKKNNIEIALHGLTHKNIKSEYINNNDFKFYDENIKSEFGKIFDYDEQYRRLIKGKFLLDSLFQTNIVTFIPPYNHYNSKTLKALSNANFSIISASLYKAIPYDKAFKINYLPTTFELDQFYNKILRLSKNTITDKIIVITFHPYTFSKKISLNNLRRFIQDLKKNRLISFYTFKDLVRHKVIFNSTMIRVNLEKNLLKNLFFSKYALYNTALLIFIKILNVLVHVLICTVIYFIISNYFSRINNKTNNSIVR
jgi:peptidoglycan/xylan/chitin deacetylase (PgdA/CDA1 family)